jgi:hypothetical protein
VSLTLNPYGFAADSPTNESDPTGSFSLSNLVGQAWIDSGAYNFFATHTVGGCLSGSAGFFGYGSGSVCAEVDGGYDAFSYSGTGGANTGPSATIGISGIYSNQVDTTSGGSFSATQGGGAGELLTGGLDVSEGRSSCGALTYTLQPSIGLGVGEPVDLHTGLTYTYTDVLR